METSTDSMKSPVIANIRAEWDWVKEGVEEVISTNSYATFRPEDIYASCLTGESALWVCRPDWFVVSTIEVDQFNGQKSFLVWLWWTRERGNRVASDFLPFFEMVAKESGCDVLEGRIGHKKVAEYIERDLGYDCQQIVFSKTLK